MAGGDPGRHVEDIQLSGAWKIIKISPDGGERWRAAQAKGIVWKKVHPSEGPGGRSTCRRRMAGAEGIRLRGTGGRVLIAWLLLRSH